MTDYRFDHNDRVKVDHGDARRSTFWPPRRYQRHLQFPEPESHEHAKELIMDCGVAEVRNIGRDWSPWVIMLDGTVWESHDTRALAIKTAKKFSKIVRGKVGDPSICDQRLLLFVPPYGKQSA